MKLKHVIVPSLVLVASSAFAEGAAKGPDLSALTNSIDFSNRFFNGISRYHGCCCNHCYIICGICWR